MKKYRICWKHKSNSRHHGEGEPVFDTREQARAKATKENLDYPMLIHWVEEVEVPDEENNVPTGK